MHEPDSTLQSLNRQRQDSLARQNINEMLRPPPLSQVDTTPPKAARDGSVPMLAMIIGGLVFFFIGIDGLFSGSFWGIVLGGLGAWAFVWGNANRTNIIEEDRHVRRYNEHEQGHRMNLERLAMTQRVDALNALKELEIAKGYTDAQRHDSNNQVLIAQLQTKAQVESAKYQAMGVAGDKEFIREYAKLQADLDKEKVELELGFQSRESERQREHQTEEAEKDRQLAIDQLITKFEGQIEQLKTRMDYEKPDAQSRMAEETVMLEGKIAQLKQIKKYEKSDPVLYHNLMKKYQREFC